MTDEKPCRQKSKRNDDTSKKKPYRPPAIIEEAAFARLAGGCNMVTGCFINVEGTSPN